MEHVAGTGNTRRFEVRCMKWAAVVCAAVFMSAALAAEDASDERPALPFLPEPAAWPIPPMPIATAAARRTPAPLHAWVDQSLMQQSTTWLPGDELRFQHEIKTPREGMSGLKKGAVGFVVLAGVTAAGWFR